MNQRRPTYQVFVLALLIFRMQVTRKEAHTYVHIEIMAIIGHEKLKMLTENKNIKEIAGVSVLCE